MPRAIQAFRGNAPKDGTYPVDDLRLYLGEQRLRRVQDVPAPLPLLRDWQSLE